MCAASLANRWRTLKSAGPVAGDHYVHSRCMSNNQDGEVLADAVPGILDSVKWRSILNASDHFHSPLNTRRISANNFAGLNGFVRKPTAPQVLASSCRGRS